MPKMYTFKSYLFINWKKFPHTKHDKLGYHPIHYTHDTDYQIRSRNKIELRQQSSKYSVIYHSLLLFVIWFGGSLVYAVYF